MQRNNGVKLLLSQKGNSFCRIPGLRDLLCVLIVKIKILLMFPSTASLQL